MTTFRPYYLYFLDRELLSTLDLYEKVPFTAVLHDTVMCLLSTPFESYCSLSLVFESDYANELYSKLLCLFANGDIVLNMSGARSLVTWAEEKRRQYHHTDRRRYHRYMGDEWERVAETSPTIRCRAVNTTDDLSVSLTDYIESGKCSELVENESVFAPPKEIAVATGPIVEAIHGRGEKAITKQLFVDAYRHYNISQGTRRLFDLSVSIQYVSSQLEEFEATVPVNGALPIHDFDDLSTNYPLNDLSVWAFAYRKLGLYRDMFALRPEELAILRESESFNALLERIARAILGAPRVNQVRLFGSVRGVVRSRKKSALARILQNSAALLSTEWPFDQLPRERTIAMANHPDPRKVFVIHGRDVAARNAVFAVLDALGLRPIEWSQALNAAHEPSPYIGDVLDSAMREAQAIIVLLTGDDEARLREEFLVDDDGEQERNLTPQPRPNVIFEAGMALGQFPGRTILLSIGRLRQFSDIQGRHVLRWSNAPEARHGLAERLKKAGCAVDTTGTRWLNAGPL